MLWAKFREGQMNIYTWHVAL